MKRQVILFCIPPSCGGAERVTLTIAKLLDSTSFDIKIAIIGKTEGEIIDFIPKHMEVFHVRINNIWDFTTLRLVQLFKKTKPTFVFCSLMHLNTRVISAAKIVQNIKIIIRNNIGFYRMRADNAFLIKKLYPYADKIILQTEEMKKEMIDYLKIDKQKLHVIFNPIDTESINRSLFDCQSPLDKNYTNYIFVGRIDYSKGLDILIPAFAKLAEKKTDCRLYIIGKISKTNEYYKRLVNYISDLKLEDKVIWTDFTTNPYQYIKFADCLVLPSRVEGLPNVVLDAMYLKTPVVLTRSVPVIERLVPPSRGIIVDVEDADTLAQAMYNVLNIKVIEEYNQISNSEIVNLFKL